MFVVQKALAILLGLGVCDANTQYKSPAYDGVQVDPQRQYFSVSGYWVGSSPGLLVQNNLSQPGHWLPHSTHCDATVFLGVLRDD